MDQSPSTELTVDHAFIMRAVALADLDAVRVALYQLTSDEALAALPIAAAMNETQRAGLREKAAAWLFENAGAKPVAEPPEAELRRLMNMSIGGEMGDLEFTARRDLPAFKDFPYAAQWPGEKPDIPKNFKVAIIGSGISGVTMAVQLDVLGIPYVVLERRAEPGGVWSINRYPDVRVDTSSITYEFPFVKDYAWSEYFGRGSEVRKYVTDVSKKFGVRANTLFEHDLNTGRFDETRDLWVLDITTPAGPVIMEVNALVSCGGLYTTPNLPDFPGRENFKGQILHPSRWPDIDLTGKRVATIGNGSTGVQLLGAIAAVAEQVHVFQRTPQWIMPRDKYGKPVEPEIAWLLKNFPGYWNWWRFTATAALFDTHGLMLTDPEWKAQGGKVNAKNDAVRVDLTKYIEYETKGREDLIEKLVPDYAPFSRRPVVDNGWYRALTRDNVELVTETIARLTPEGIETADGKSRQVDVIVAATGFEVVKYLWPAKFVGTGGVDLHDSWMERDGPRAYIGMAVPRFPNMYMLYGPNSQPVSGGPAQPIWFAAWANFAAQGIMQLLLTGNSRIEVKQQAYDRYNAALDVEASKLVQMTTEGGIERNYYVNNTHQRLQVNAPWYSPYYYQLCTQVTWSDFELSGALPTTAETAGSLS